jgi:SAM-dependent methyltransferase
VCSESSSTFAPGPGGRSSARCPRCNALERHRFLALLVRALQPADGVTGLTLDVAPSTYLSPLIEELSTGRYVAIDFDPDADGRRVDVRASLTDIPLRSESVRVLVCYHVLEHVPDDASAMAEIARVLSPGGIALVQVPWRPGATDEDPTAPVEERIRRFGQADHVRWYGDDFVERLRSAGLHVTELTPGEVLPPAAVQLVGAVAGERTWICTSDPDALPALERIRETVADQLADVTSQVLAQGVRREDLVAAAEARARAAETRATMWRTRYQDLRGKLPVRAMSAMSRPFRRSASS